MNKISIWNILILCPMSLIIISCSKKLHKNTFTLENKTSNNSSINWKLNSQDLDSARVITKTDTLLWYTAYGNYNLKSTDIELDFNTYDKKKMQSVMDNAIPFLNRFDHKGVSLREYLNEDFQAKGWTYDYIVDYLVEKTKTKHDYQTITQLDDFEAKSMKALKMLKLKRIGIFDANFDSPTNGVNEVSFVLDYWIEDMNTLMTAYLSFVERRCIQLFVI